MTIWNGMFQVTSPQRPLFGAEHLVSEAKRVRLEQTWAHHSISATRGISSARSTGTSW